MAPRFPIPAWLPTLLLALAPGALATAQTDPPPDVAEAVETALEDSASAPGPGDSRIDPDTVRQLEEMFGVEGITVVSDPQDVARIRGTDGTQAEPWTPPGPAIQPYSPEAGGGSDWLAQQLAASGALDAEQRERERRRQALRLATGVVLFFGIMLLMLKKPWEGKELPRPAPPPPTPPDDETGD